MGRERRWKGVSVDGESCFDQQRDYHPATTLVLLLFVVVVVVVSAVVVLFFFFLNETTAATLGAEASASAITLLPLHRLNRKLHRNLYRRRKKKERRISGANGITSASRKASCRKNSRQN